MQRQANYPVLIGSEGELTNPSSGDVAADSGAIASEDGGGGVYEALVNVSSTALAEFAVQRRNAANGANVGTAPIIYCPANSGRDPVFRFEIERGERIRVVLNANLTGTCVANITVQRVA